MSLKTTDNQEVWICPFPDIAGNYIPCNYRGGIPAVEPGSTRAQTSCLPCKLGRVVHNLINLSALIKGFTDLARASL